MKYAIMKKEGGRVSVKRACELLDVRRQGYYEWRQRERSPRQMRDELLTAKIKDIFYGSKRIYGARKIVSTLWGQGERVSRRRVRRLMQASGLVPVTYRRHVHTTDSNHSLSVFPNLLKQDFHACAANRIWVTDITYIPTDEGWLYLCSVMDLYSRRVIGWATSASIDRNLAIAALENAVKNRKPGKGWILHSDRGSQYASSDFRNAVVRAGGLQSMSHSGNPYDNACAESFFRSLKVEWINLQHFARRDDAVRAIAEYLLFYNRLRIHATLGYLSPVDFETQRIPRVA